MFTQPWPSFQTDTKTERHQTANTVIRPATVPTAELHKLGRNTTLFNCLTFFAQQKQQGAGSVLAPDLCCSKDPLLEEDLERLEV